MATFILVTSLPLYSLRLGSHKQIPRAGIVYEVGKWHQKGKVSIRAQIPKQGWDIKQGYYISKMPQKVTWAHSTEGL